MSVSAEDRETIANLHGPPPNNRDASQGAARHWKNEPTKIMAPTNPSRATGIYNPFSHSRTKDTLRQPRGGNPAAQSTVLGYSSARSGPPPTKKTKLEGNLPPRSSRKRHSPNENSRRKSEPQEGSGIIYVTDEYEEDTGILVTAEVDDLNIGPHQARHNRVIHDGERRRSIPDGEHTAYLRQTQHRPPLAPDPDSDDPIESYEPEPSIVKQRVHVLESKARTAELESTSYPMLDLRDKEKIKSKMKLKNPVASAVSPYLTLKPNPPNKPRDVNFLPVEAWYLGRKFFEESYHISWTGRTKMIIRSGDAPGPAARHTVDFDIGIIAEAVSYIDPKENSPSKFFVLDTFPKIKPTDKPIAPQYSQYFTEGGPRGSGMIMLKFNCASSAWSNATYNAFVEWFKRVVSNRQVLRPIAGNTKWEATGRVAELAEARANRLNSGSSTYATPKAIPTTTKPTATTKPAVSGSVPGLPPLKEYSPPWMVSERRGSSSTPIEVESPIRPAPRPTYRGPDSVDVDGGLQPARRSVRKLAPQKPLVDPDEVILVYPPGQTGAVNITNGDVTRLAPGEFLNDTLIEFGLKLWLQQLEKDDPELVKQIHVFSSFFYKKLNKKNTREGYESVRKWTSKFDLFDKKYIIVPINENLHWYLAIIYHPEYTLLPPPPIKSPSTRRKGRREPEKSPEPDHLRETYRAESTRAPDSKASSVTRRTPTPGETNGSSNGDAEMLSPTSNAQVDEVHDQLVAACTITDDDSAGPGRDNAADCATDGGFDSLFGDDHAMDVDNDVPVPSEGARGLSPQPRVSLGPTDDAGSHAESEGPAVSHPEIMEVDEQDDVANESMDPLNILPSARPARPSAEVVKPHRFYGTAAKYKGKRKADSPPLASPPLETFPPQESPLETYEDDAEVIVEGGPPRTYVFTLDSLGTRHPKVVNVLGQYLQYEAQEKKGIPIESSSKPAGKMALVPHQPNFCDCGIYLLHLAQTFISDPLRYYTLITTKRGNTNSSERQADWNDERTKNLREDLTRSIQQLSIEWKKDRAVKDELKKEELKKKEDQKEAVIPESSDDEVDIVDTTPNTPTTPAPRRKVKVGRVSRMRG
ncbi:hypothetical protein B0H15DRAFT_1019804 [Mycena belliarum]|uniref:Ubiquitin-like protease family profile domain-containing protein n=1 Tax=Mycena belliarum TaxID=1033014 RepID=A0AAD6UEK4_9AGAR|nr:hypothetical protein B0H15DRAFT_1019804 [Mycena belliae]